MMGASSSAPSTSISPCLFNLLSTMMQFHSFLRGLLLWGGFTTLNPPPPFWHFPHFILFYHPLPQLSCLRRHWLRDTPSTGRVCVCRSCLLGSQISLCFWIGEPLFRRRKFQVYFFGLLASFVASPDHINLSVAPVARFCGPILFVLLPFFLCDYAV